MPNNIFDTHSHYTSDQFSVDRTSLLDSLPTAGVCGVIDCATEYASATKILQLCEQYPYMYCAVGIHPESVCEVSIDEIAKIETLLGNKNVVAIGEIGLDYHWDMPRDLQKDFFEKQLQLAQKHNLPIILHDREAHQDMFDIVKKYSLEGVLHCYSGSAELAAQIIKATNLHFGFGGALTFKNAKKAIEAATCIPIERILLETDCPYMSPVPFRGKRCDSSMVYYVAEVLGQIKNLSTQQVLDITYQNTKTLFNI